MEGMSEGLRDLPSPGIAPVLIDVGAKTKDTMSEIVSDALSEFGEEPPAATPGAGSGSSPVGNYFGSSVARVPVPEGTGR